MRTTIPPARRELRRQQDDTGREVKCGTRAPTAYRPAVPHTIKAASAPDAPRRLWQARSSAVLARRPRGRSEARGRPWRRGPTRRQALAFRTKTPPDRVRAVGTDQRPACRMEADRGHRRHPQDRPAPDEARAASVRDHVHIDWSPPLRAKRGRRRSLRGPTARLWAEAASAVRALAPTRPGPAGR